MESMQSYVYDHEVEFGVGLSGLIFFPFVIRSLFAVLSERGRKVFIRRGKDYRLLLIHIGMSIWVVCWYEYRSLTAPSGVPGKSIVVTPSRADIAIGFANAAASWFLARNNINGSPRVTRTTFQALAIVMALMSLMMLSSGWHVPHSERAQASAAWWYRALSKTHFAFVYVRMVGITTRFCKMCKSPGEAFNLAVFGGCTMGVIAAIGWVGGPLMLGLIAGLNLLEQRLSITIFLENATNLVPRLLLLVGLVEQDTYTALKDTARERQKTTQANSDLPSISLNQ